MKITIKTFIRSLITEQREELEEWSKAMDPKDIISVGYTPNGAICVFYWTRQD